MSTRSPDLLVLGSGPSGAAVAKRCAEAGREVVLVENLEVGGTCALRGCNPKKVLVEAADLLDRVRRAEGKLLRGGDARIDWRELSAFVRTFTEPVPQRSRASLEKAGAEVLVGSPRFTDADTLAVDTADGATHTFTPGQVVLATGARPRTLRFEGAELVTTSDEFLELRELPRRILFVGGGYISFEFAHVAARAGVDVAIWTSGDRALREFDAELVDALVERTRGLGIDVRFAADVTRVTRGDDGPLQVGAEGDGAATGFDLVVHGAGREASLDGLQLDRAGVDTDARGVLVDAFLRSPGNRRVLAVGDCASAGHAPLTPVANAHAHAVARNLLDGEDRHRPDVDGVASALFTVPSLARVGLDERQARDADIPFELREGDWSRFASVRKVAEPCARYKLLFAPDDGPLLGAHLLGPAAHEVINLCALAVRAQLTSADLKSAPLVFPSAGHDLRSMV